RDEGYMKLVAPALTRFLSATKVGGADISHFVFQGPGDIPAKIAKGLGIDPAKLADSLESRCGDVGSAHPLLVLSHVLERARPGETILVAAFGQGVEAMLLRVTDAIDSARPRYGVSGYLDQRAEERQYMKLPIFNRLMPYDKGMRAEFDRKATLSMMYRKRDFLGAFVGGRCTKCGTVQIPRTRACAECTAIDTQEPFSFADEKG